MAPTAPWRKTARATPRNKKNSKWSESKNFFFQNYLKNLNITNITQKSELYIILYEFLSILGKKTQKSADHPTLDPPSWPPYGSKFSNFFSDGPEMKVRNLHKISARYTNNFRK